MQRVLCYLITIFSSIFFWCGGFLLLYTFGGDTLGEFQQTVQRLMLEKSPEERQNQEQGNNETEKKITNGKDEKEDNNRENTTTQKTESADHDCQIEVLENGDYRMHATCILKQQLPTMTIQEIVDTIWEDVIDFEQIYEPFSLSASYYGSTPLYRESASSRLSPNIEKYKQLLEMEQSRETLNISKKELARYLAQDLSFYASDKDLSLLGPCTRKNYQLALERIDQVTLAPWEVYNANKELAKIRSYCTGRGEKNFLFYGGVCGMTAQFFRTTLMHPDIEVLTRRPHNERFTLYYGEEVGGDDAAIYELSKQFEIKNIGENDIYFRIIIQENRSFLVAISPKNHMWVEINKTPIHSLAINLTKTVFVHEEPTTILVLDTPLSQIQKQTSIGQDSIMRQEFFESRYIKKNRETR